MGHLLTIAPPTHELPRETLDTRGGFVWWYADVLDAEGNGVVLIWSFGLPFLPGYAAAAREGRPEAPRQRPSLNVSVYEKGRLVCYLLQELDPDEVSWGDDSWRFGCTTIASRVTDGVRTVEAHLDCAIPASQDRLTGTVTIAGPARRPRPEDTLGGVHDWSPLVAVAEGHVDLRAGSEAYRVAGRGYHDCNAGAQPLHDAGIWAWTWGRVPGENEERIYYVLWPTRDSDPEAHGVTIGADGTLATFPLRARITSQRIGVAGLRHPRRIELFREDSPRKPWLVSHLESVVDDGPFYARHFIRSDGGTLGMGEYCRTDLIDLAIHRPLVRMRVHRADGDNSMWLPLFTGPRDGRLTRLLHQFRPAP